MIQEQIQQLVETFKNNRNLKLRHPQGPHNDQHHSQEQIDAVYNGAKAPTMGDGE